MCSNILAFFFDPNNPHGFGTLFLDALARVDCKNDGVESIVGDITVHREVHTKGDKFIDILIESESHAILIENKIYARTDYNPYKEYAEHLRSLRKPKEWKFLLTLRRVGEKCGFHNITYEQFAKALRRQLGEYVSAADTRFLTFMLDFLNTIENLQGDLTMNEELVKFLNEHSEDSKRFFKEIDTFRDKLREKVKQLGKLINADSYGNVKRQWSWREKHGLFDVLVHDIKLFSFENNVVVNAIVCPAGWKVEFFVRNEEARPDSKERLKTLLRSRKIQIDEDGDDHCKRFTLRKCFKYDEHLETVARDVRDVVKKLADNDAAQ